MLTSLEGVGMVSSSLQLQLFDQLLLPVFTIKHLNQNNYNHLPLVFINP